MLADATTTVAAPEMNGYLEIVKSSGTGGILLVVLAGLAILLFKYIGKPTLEMLQPMVQIHGEAMTNLRAASEANRDTATIHSETVKSAAQAAANANDTSKRLEQLIENHRT